LREDERSVYVNDYEHRVMVNGLSESRNMLIREDRPADDVDDLLLKIIDAPYRCPKQRTDRDER